MRTQSGFTIIELLIAMAILVVLVTLSSNFAIRSLQAQRIVGEQNQAVVEARQALNRFTNEMREAAPSDTGAYPIEYADTHELIFFSDVDHDQTTERIHYYVDGSQLMRSVIEPSGDPLVYSNDDAVVQVVSSYVRNGEETLFFYYNDQYPEDTENNPLASPINLSAIQMVEMSIRTNVDPDRVPNTYVLETTAHLRNLKENF